MADSLCRAEAQLCRASAFFPVLLNDFLKAALRSGDLRILVLVTLYFRGFHLLEALIELSKIICTEKILIHDIYLPAGKFVYHLKTSILHEGINFNPF